MCRSERTDTPGYSLVPLIAGAALAAALLAAGCGKRFRAEGLVTAVDAGRGWVTISHREIPGYMPAMMMPFRLAKPEAARTLHPGDRVRFEVRRSLVRNLRVIATRQDFALPPTPAARLRAGDTIPSFELTDQAGARVRLSDFRGRVVAVDFVYTRCPLPDVCPRLSAAFAFASRALRDRPVTFLSITVDPQYDTPEVLGAYAQRWRAGPAWRFLTGPMDRVREAAGLFGLVFWPEENMIAHTVTTAVIDGDGRLAATIEGSSFRPAELRDLIISVLEK